MNNNFLKTVLAITFISIICLSCEKKDENNQPANNNSSTSNVTNTSTDTFVVPEGYFYSGPSAIKSFNSYYTILKTSSGNILTLYSTDEKGNASLKIELYTTAENFEKGNYSFVDYGENKTTYATLILNEKTYVSTNSGNLNFTDGKKFKFIGNSIFVKNTNENDQFYRNTSLSFNISASELKVDTLK